MTFADRVLVDLDRVVMLYSKTNLVVDAFHSEALEKRVRE
jgi:hypothetical protein